MVDEAKMERNDLINQSLIASLLLSGIYNNWAISEDELNENESLSLTFIGKRSASKNTGMQVALLKPLRIMRINRLMCETGF